MTGSTKILTVSYGTFSCTLEGFDDPFGTMRGIAEYFRDLAADDRYFGAEPPTPDVEMLQRIAQKEVERRVEARIGDTGVALTQLTDAAREAPAPDKPAAQAEPEAAPETTDRQPEVPEPEAEPDTPDAPESDAFGYGPLTHDDEYLMADEPEDVLAVDPDARTRAEGPAETVAEKLRRIRAVVSRSIEPADDGETPPVRTAPVETVDSGDDAPMRDRAMTETIRQITADLSDDEGGDEDEGDAPEEVLAETEDEAEDWSFDTEDTLEADAGAHDGPESALDVSGSDDFDVETSEDAAEDETTEIAAESDESGTPEAEPAGENALLTDTDEDDAASDDNDVAARVSDLLADVSDQDDPDDEDLDDDVTDEDDSEEDDADETDDVLSLEPDAEVAPPADGGRRTSRPLKPIERDEDVGRLMAETDNHLNDDESIRRRRVISQMRAAVAATKADRLVSRRVSTREEDSRDDQERYRDDLSEAVRGVSHPLVKDGSHRKHSVAPLVLVSSQRVEPSAFDDAKPKADGEEDTQDTESFAGFARSMGARDLAELLEAAAAYTSFVEGQPSFSRPEIMKRVARVDPTLKLSREDGLRSFGQLLRQGKFRKLERGQFTIDESTRFKPQHRYAGE